MHFASVDKCLFFHLVPEDCWYYDGYEEDCPEGCVWTHFSRGDGMCNAPGVAATRSLSEEKAVGAGKLLQVFFSAQIIMKLLFL